MQYYVCTRRKRDEAGRLISYTLLGENGVIELSTDELIEKLKNNDIEVEDLMFDGKRRIRVKEQPEKIAKGLIIKHKKQLKEQKALVTTISQQNVEVNSTKSIDIQNKIEKYHDFKIPIYEYGHMLTHYTPVNLKFKVVNDIESFVNRAKFLGYDYVNAPYTEFVILVRHANKEAHMCDMLIIAPGKIRIACSFKRQSDLISVDLSACSAIRPECMRELFMGCTELKYVNLGTLDFSRAEYIEGMFQSTPKLKQIVYNGDYIDFSNAKNMLYVFAGCGDISECGFIEKIKTSNKLVDLGSMFADSLCTKISFGDEFDTSGVTHMTSMFNNCKYLESIQFGKKFKTDKLQVVSYMYRHCIQLFNGMFCNTLYPKHLQSVTSTFKYIDGNYLKLSNIIIDDITDCIGTFEDAKIRTLEFNNITIKGIPSLNEVFRNAKIGVLNLSGLRMNWKKIKSFKNVFFDCDISELYMTNQLLDVRTVEKVFSVMTSEPGHIKIGTIYLTEGLDTHIENKLKEIIPGVKVVWLPGRKVGDTGNKK